MGKHSTPSGCFSPPGDSCPCSAAATAGIWHTQISKLFSCRIVKVDLSNPGPLSDWQDVVSQHEKDLLEWACALKVSNQQASIANAASSAE